MSEYDGGDIGGHDDGASYGDVNAGHEDLNLDQGHQAFGNEHDHLTDEQAYGNEHASELDEHFAQGHHVESDTPASHFEEDNFTNADVHASETDSNFGEHFVDADHAANFGEADFLHENAEIDQLQEHFFSGGDEHSLGAGSEHLLEGGAASQAGHEDGGHISAVSN